MKLEKTPVNRRKFLLCRVLSYLRVRLPERKLHLLFQNLDQILQCKRKQILEINSR
jgi:hypothetical protein